MLETKNSEFFSMLLFLSRNKGNFRLLNWADINCSFKPAKEGPSLAKHEAYCPKTFILFHGSCVQMKFV
jgi:hypothetical protein